MISQNGGPQPPPKPSIPVWAWAAGAIVAVVGGIVWVLSYRADSECQIAIVHLLQSNRCAVIGVVHGASTFCFFSGLATLAWCVWRTAR